MSWSEPGAEDIPGVSFEVTGIGGREGAVVRMFDVVVSTAGIALTSAALAVSAAGLDFCGGANFDLLDSGTFAASGPSLALCAGVSLDLFNSASLAALLIRLVSAPLKALARLSLSSFSFILRSCSSRVPNLRVTFFNPLVNASISELGDIADRGAAEFGVGDCAPAGCGAAW